MAVSVPIPCGPAEACLRRAPAYLLHSQPPQGYYSKPIPHFLPALRVSLSLSYGCSSDSELQTSGAPGHVRTSADAVPSLECLSGAINSTLSSLLHCDTLEVL